MTNPDIVAAKLDPLAHYLQRGIHEHRARLGHSVWAW